MHWVNAVRWGELFYRHGRDTGINRGEYLLVASSE